MASLLPNRFYHQLAVSLSYGSLIGAFVVNADFSWHSHRITRADLIRMIEAQISRDPAALAYLAGARANGA